jgi:cytochrome c
LRNPNVLVADADGFRGLDFNKNKSVATVTEKGAYVLLKQVDLNSLKSLTVAGTDRTGCGAFEVRLDSADGNPVAKSVTSDNGARSLTARLAETTGKHDVFIVFNDAGSRITSITVADK